MRIIVINKYKILAKMCIFKIILSKNNLVLKTN